MPEHFRITRDRREFISDAFCGFGSLAFASLCRAAAVNSLAAKRPELPAKAKSVIFLFMAGGPSHLETFDPKPLLNQLNGQKRPASFGEAKYQFITGDGATIIILDSRCGWRAALSRAAMWSALRMPLDYVPLISRVTSATSTPLSCISWDLTRIRSPTCIRGAKSVLRNCRAE